MAVGKGMRLSRVEKSEFCSFPDPSKPFPLFVRSVPYIGRQMASSARIFFAGIGTTFVIMGAGSEAV
jgi:hypothetical protein